MSVEGIADALALRAETVAGIKKAYAVGANPAVAKLPSQIADGPVCLVMWDGTTVNNGSSFEDLEHRYVLHIYVAATDEGFSYRTLVPFVSLFNAAMRTDRDLGGACTWASLEGADALEATEINGRPYNRLPIRIVAREITPGVTTGI